MERFGAKTSHSTILLYSICRKRFGRRNDEDIVVSHKFPD